ncbi:Serine/threonine-protein kinase TNNI3K [Termitomyces sp. T112]|nr:Serine/threonine-protein kinase TNNI3K [Termitomyces sp. T112]
MAHGSIGDYLKRVRWESQRRKESVNKVPYVAYRRVDYLQMMHDIAKGMRYLHDHGVYHGDLKAANVLLAEDLHCVVSDFGLSKWIHQLEEKNFPLNNALRWQAPELMSGGSVPTKKADVYAFAMCCIEILTMGSIPWPTMKDDDVKQHVLYEEGRPPYPEDLVRDLKVENLLHISWHQSPSNRPSFKLLVQKLLVLRDEVMTPDVVLSSPRVIVSAPPELQDQDSSPYHKFVSPVSHEFDDPISLSPRGEYSTPLVATFSKLQSEVPLKDESEEEIPLEDSLLLNFDPSPPKPPSTLKEDDMAMKDSYDGQFEITYSMCLSHEFPRQLNFPLWTPGDIQLGDIGFLSSSGQFIRLFNSFDPWRSSGNRMNIPGIGNVSIAVRHQKDHFVRKGIKAISELVSTGESGPNDRIKRRHTFSLSGRRTAFLCADKTHHRYIQDSRPCKQWFRNYWHAIIHEYGPQHILMKEDLMFIIETLSARNHALFVNHGHLDDKAHFEVFTSPASGESWGTFTLPPDLKHNAPQSFFEKVSVVGSPSQTILIARLRFLTDVEEPTLLNI